MLIRGDCWAFDPTPNCENGLDDEVLGELAGLEADVEAAGAARVVSEGLGDVLDALPPSFARRLLRICHYM